MRKLISFDDETYASLADLGRSRMATIQDIADEAFADVLKKHGMPVDLRDALRKSIKAAGQNGGPRKTAIKTANHERVPKLQVAPARARAAKRKTERKTERKTG